MKQTDEKCQHENVLEGEYALETIYHGLKPIRLPRTLELDFEICATCGEVLVCIEHL